MVIFIGMIMLAIVAAMLGFGFGYDNGWHNASDYLDDALDVVNDWKRRCREAEDRLLPMAADLDRTLAI